MQITLKTLPLILDKISVIQLLSLCLVSLFFLMKKEYCIFTGILISGLASSLYTQLIKISSYNKSLAFLGFPLRLIVVALPAAILVHNLRSNLIALFLGFFLSQIIYFCYIWSYTNREENSKKCR